MAIARAIVGERRLLLADEPTGALDSTNGESVMRMLRTACQDGVAGVVVTHDAQLASWAHRVVFMRDGRIVDQTPPLAGRRVAARRSTTLTVRADNGGTAARRAVLRWARRSFRREWRQQLLVSSIAHRVGGGRSRLRHRERTTPWAYRKTRCSVRRTTASPSRSPTSGPSPTSRGGGRTVRWRRCDRRMARSGARLGRIGRVPGPGPDRSVLGPMLARLDGRYPMTQARWRSPTGVAATLQWRSATLSTSTAEPGRWLAWSRTRATSTTSSHSSRRPSSTTPKR